ncbi:SaoD/DsrE family protein [Acidimicrobiia bacterium]|nr:SaoD/DsrE family protein [Acidimicrobiia bacterium]
MKVAYILNSPNAANYKVGEMILPQLEADNHGVEVVGIFFFDENTMLLQKGNPKGERLAKVAAEKGMLLMMCDQCANQRGLASKNAEGGYTPEGTVEGVAAGCFPDLYQALSGNMPDQVISL